MDIMPDIKLVKPKLAVIRGPYFSMEEQSFYEPLKDKFDMTFFSSLKESIAPEGNPNVLGVKYLGGILNPLTGGVYRKIAGLCGNIAGVDPEYIFGAKKALRGFDIVQTIDYNYLITYEVAQLKKKLGFRLAAIHWENIPFARDAKPLCKFVKYKVYEQVDAFFAMSERAKASLLLEGVDESRIFVTYYAVDTEKFKPDSEAGREGRKKYGLADDDIVILFIGRVRASKGLFELMYATRRLLSDPAIDRRKIKLVIVGKGPGEKDVSMMTARLGLKDNVMQIGYIRHDDIPHIHNMADVFCGPSLPRKYWQEQLGLVFLEAMACGKPVVSTLSGSIPEVVGDAGLLVQPNDHLSLFEALRRIVTETDLRRSLSQKARERAVSRFSNEVISTNIQNAYRKILTGSDVI